MLHLRARLLQVPTENKLDILHQVARKLHVSNISRMILRPNVVMLQDARRIEVVHKAVRTLPALVERPVVEVLNDILDLIDKGCALLVGVAYLTEAFPEGEDDDLGVWPAGAYLINQLNVAIVELSTGDVVAGVVVVSAEVDYGDVGGCVGGEVPVRYV